MNWDKHKSSDGSIDLVSVLEEAIPFEVRCVAFSDAARHLQGIMAMQPIFSRQAAAVAIAQAVQIAQPGNAL